MSDPEPPAWYRPSAAAGGTGEADILGSEDEASEASGDEVMRGGETESDSEGGDEEAEEEEGGEDLFDDNELIPRDYREEPELDHYDETLLDSTTGHRELTGEEREAAEREMRERDVREGRGSAAAGLALGPRSASGGFGAGGAVGAGVSELFGSGVAEAFLQDELRPEAADEAEALEAEQEAARKQLLRRQVEDVRLQVSRPALALINDYKAGLEDVNVASLGVQRGAPFSVANLWTDQLKAKLEIVILGFLWYGEHRTATISLDGGKRAGSTEERDAEERSSEALERERRRDAKNPYYIQQALDLLRDNLQSYKVDCNDLEAFCPPLRNWLFNLPLELISLFESVVSRLIVQLKPRLVEARFTCAVRFIGLKIEHSIRHLSLPLLNKLIVLRGVCVRRSSLIPRLSVIYLHCLRCGNKNNGPYMLSDFSRAAYKKTRQAPVNPAATAGLDGGTGTGSDRPPSLATYTSQAAFAPNRKVCICCQAEGPFDISKERTAFENFQKIVIQEVSSEVPPGHVPRTQTVILLGDLADSVKPGEEITLTGIYEAKEDLLYNAKSGFPLFSTWIVANSVEKLHEKILEEITDADKDLIVKLSKNKSMRNKVISSIAPSLFGHRHIKTAIAYSMFGGVRGCVGGEAAAPAQLAGAAGHFGAPAGGSSGGSGMAVRGDINLLIVGDPGLGKSQFLKYVERTHERAILTSGRGASAVGLTAAVRRDAMTGEFQLEGGAFVLADEGICLVDEFDKMSDQDRVSIHEAMEQQTISISKAGIVASLRARCAVIAAANPIGGRYNISRDLTENVELEDPILSRFDIVAVVRDECFNIIDYQLACHVLATHHAANPGSAAAANPGANVAAGSNSNSGSGKGIGRGGDTNSGTLGAGSNGAGNNASGIAADGPDMNTNPKTGDPMWVTDSGRIPDTFLRKYITYARRNCRPLLTSHCDQLIINFYANFRRFLNGCQGSMAFTPRHLESIIRLACANAKMELSPYVERIHCEYAIASMVESVIAMHRKSVADRITTKFAHFRMLASHPNEVFNGLLLRMLSAAHRREIAHHFAANPALTQSHTQSNTHAQDGSEASSTRHSNAAAAGRRLALTQFEQEAKKSYQASDLLLKQYFSHRDFTSKFSIESASGQPYIVAV